MAQESRVIRFLYGSVIGRCMLKILVCPGISRAVGRYLESPHSKWLIPRFIKKHGIDMSGYERGDYQSFNAFFIRRRKAAEVKIDVAPHHLISPCDGYLSVYPIDKDRRVRIKHVEYSIRELLDNELLAASYRNGTCFVFRLTPQDYHRYCYIDDGIKGKNFNIKGKLHCVRSLACETYPVYIRNSRSYTVIQTMSFGKVVQMEVGALLVGKINNYHEDREVLRGEEKGYFSFGGSTVILLMEKGSVAPEERIMINMLIGKETRVRMGEKIASRQDEKR